jgi:hypothetical protein
VRPAYRSQGLTASLYDRTKTLGVCRLSGPNAAIIAFRKPEHIVENYVDSAGAVRSASPGKPNIRGANYGASSLTPEETARVEAVLAE